MEERVRGCDIVLIICTPNYKRKADKREGGVGYESNIITAELYKLQSESKFLPLLFDGDWDSSFPIWAEGKMGIDFRTAIEARIGFVRLVEHLKQLDPERVTSDSNERDKGQDGSLSRDRTNEQIRIVRIISEEIGFPANDGTMGSALYSIPFELSREPNSIWVELFIESWNSPPRWTTLHRPGIARISGKKVILDRTTIEEVEKVHKDTLLLAVQEANRKEQEALTRKRLTEAKERETLDKHIDNVTSKSKRISFDDV